QGANVVPNAADAEAVEHATECLINRVRASRGLRALHHNRTLQRVASGQVRQMVRWDYFADVRPTGQTAGALIASTHYAAHRGQRLRPVAQLVATIARAHVVAGELAHALQAVVDGVAVGEQPLGGAGDVPVSLQEGLQRSDQIGLVLLVVGDERLDRLGVEAL